jgi:hypothetical protein
MKKIIFSAALFLVVCLPMLKNAALKSNGQEG